MRTAMVHEELLEERRRMGHDKRDEVWAGVLHMVPPPTLAHSDVARELLLILVRIARRNGMDAFIETGLFDPTEGLRDYRVPDLIVASRDHTSQRGVEGRAAVVVEVLSPVMRVAKSFRSTRRLA